MSKKRDGTESSSRDSASCAWESFLRRPPLVLDRAAAAFSLAGKRILVTGAGGWIGSALTKAIAGFAPEHLVLLESAAFAAAAGQKVFPQYAESIESSFSIAWHRVQYNLGGWAAWSDDGRATDYPILNEPDGRIYLAGEHLSYLTGWQEGGMESAWRQITKLHDRVNA